MRGKMATLATPLYLQVSFSDANTLTKGEAQRLLVARRKALDPATLPTGASAPYLAGGPRDRDRPCGLLEFLPCDPHSQRGVGESRPRFRLPDRRLGGMPQAAEPAALLRPPVLPRP